MENIAKQFQIKGSYISCEKYGCGHINGTFLLKTSEETYILQKINNHVFKDVDKLMQNISSVLDFQKTEIIKHGGDASREAMTLVLTKDNKTYFYDKENDAYYRVYEFVKGSLAIQQAENKEDFAESAKAFGKFQSLLADFDASKLFEVIPNFHNTKVRFQHFQKVLKDDIHYRAKDCQEEIQFVLDREKTCNILVDLIEEKKIPLKVTHNDTKLNNVLFDETSHKWLCVIDLDTIMPGSSLYDFGDSIRFGCNTSDENETDLSKVNFNKEYFEAYTRAYLSEVYSSLNEYELKYLPYGAILMTLECGIRFLDDYLDGNHYFAYKYEKHNLDRAKNQFKLVRCLEENLDYMNGLVEKIVKEMSK